MRREKFLKIFSLHSDDRHYAFFIKNEMCEKENQKNSWVCEEKNPKANFCKKWKLRFNLEKNRAIYYTVSQ